jgi:hypothetical protein
MDKCCEAGIGATGEMKGVAKVAEGMGRTAEMGKASGSTDAGSKAGMYMGGVKTAADAGGSKTDRSGDAGYYSDRETSNAMASKGSGKNRDNMGTGNYNSERKGR